MNNERIKEVIERGCKSATEEFHKSVEREFEKGTDEIWAHNRINAIEKSIPVLVQTAFEQILPVILDADDVQ